MSEEIIEEQISEDFDDTEQETDENFGEEIQMNEGDVVKALEVSKVTPEDLKKYNIPVKKVKVKKDKATPKEIDQMTDEEVEKSAPDQIKDLYLEFNSFLEDKAKITQDSGIKEVIPTSIDLLDSVLGGGFGIGTIAMILGAPGGGKSLLASQTVASAQRKYNGNILVAYLDSEESMTTVRLRNLGVNNPPIKPQGDITVEKVFKYIETLVMYKEMKNILDIPSILVWDSVANTLSEKERESLEMKSTLGYKARLLSFLIPKYLSKISQYNICLLTVNQLRDTVSLGPYKKPRDFKFLTPDKDIPGGNALKFNAFHLLELKVKEVLDKEKYGFDGVKVTINAVKNKLFPPNIKINLVGNFVTGFSNFWTNYDFMVNNERIKTGAWNYLVNLPQTKFRTLDAKRLYDESPEFKEAFDIESKDTIQKEILDPYTIV